MNPVAINTAARPPPASSHSSPDATPLGSFWLLMLALVS